MKYDSTIFLITPIQVPIRGGNCLSKRLVRSLHMPVIPIIYRTLEISRTFICRNINIVMDYQQYCLIALHSTQCPKFYIIYVKYTLKHHTKYILVLTLYISWKYKFDTKHSNGTMLIPIFFWNKARGQEHPGRWMIAKPKLPSFRKYNL